MKDQEQRNMLSEKAMEDVNGGMEFTIPGKSKKKANDPTITEGILHAGMDAPKAGRVDDGAVKRLRDGALRM